MGKIPRSLPGKHDQKTHGRRYGHASTIGADGGKIKANRIVSEHKSIPLKANSREVVDYLDDFGNVNNRVIYDERGNLVKQINPNNHNNPAGHPFGTNGEHAHDFKIKNGKLINRSTRELTSKERNEHEDIL